MIVCGTFPFILNQVKEWTWPKGQVLSFGSLNRKHRCSLNYSLNYSRCSLDRKRHCNLSCSRCYSLNCFRHLLLSWRIQMTSFQTRPCHPGAEARSEVTIVFCSSLLKNLSYRMAIFC